LSFGLKPGTGGVRDGTGFDLSHNTLWYYKLARELWQKTYYLSLRQQNQR
jgi:hypothetical protein